LESQKLTVETRMQLRTQKDRIALCPYKIVVRRPSSGASLEIAGRCSQHDV